MESLNARSKQIRRDVIKLSSANGGYHYGGSFSATEILITLYDKVLEPRDKFILSKGHACWPLYVLLMEKGLRPKLGGHPTLDEKNGIHFTTGSEGHGMPAAIGMALARKIQRKPGRIFVLIGDGEAQEGTTWESLLTAPHHNLDNLLVIVDCNKFQGSGAIKDILPISGLKQIANILNWRAEEIDGHNTDEIQKALQPLNDLTPRLVIANTIKGRGVSFMEGKAGWHSRFLSPDEQKQALKELE